MSTIAVRAEGLGKRYVIGGAQESYGSIRDSIAAFGRRSVARARSLGQGREAPPEIWALEDVSFEVAEGEVLGIVGRNGAGKSTLLKVLSRITEPTRGFAEIQGRVGSLLEVGTGFHPELSGRENVFLNGAIMGMSRREVVRRFDDIVDFSEVGPFIDTPVKRYSSGMYLRLAFAVAAHLEPDVLIVDEVLAVGDFAFQEKCLGKMREVGGEGRTVLFVSHNMAAVAALCSRAILLDHGRVVLSDEPRVVIDEYFQSRAGGGIEVLDDERGATGTGQARFRQVAILDDGGQPTAQLYLGQTPTVRLQLEVLQELREAVLEVGIVGADGVIAAAAQSTDGNRRPIHLTPGQHVVDVELDVHLLPRQYWLLLGVHSYDGTTHDYVEHALDFTVLNVGIDDGDTYRWPEVRGYVRPTATWRVTEVGEVSC